MKISAGFALRTMNATAAMLVIAIFSLTTHLRSNLVCDLVKERIVKDTTFSGFCQEQWGGDQLGTAVGIAAYLAAFWMMRKG